VTTFPQHLRRLAKSRPQCKPKTKRLLLQSSEEQGSFQFRPCGRCTFVSRVLVVIDLRVNHVFAYGKKEDPARAALYEYKE
jgi:hypothetical protein